MNTRYQPGQIVMQNWIIKSRLGAGSYGEVFEIQREDFGETYTAALKVISVPQSDDEYQSQLDEGMTPTQVNAYFYSVVESVIHEFSIMSKLKGMTNIVSYEDHCVVQHADTRGWDVLIRMELLTPLKRYTAKNSLTRRDIIRLGIDVLKAMELCQKYNIIHRDIKTENIFVSPNGDFKLGDFGVARIVEQTSFDMSKKGTPSYMAPEVYKGHSYNSNVDIYSLGMVLYRLLNKNRGPFLPLSPEIITFSDQEAALVKRMSGEPFSGPCYANGRLAEIVLKACAYHPMDRYTSPREMRMDLESVLYDANEAELIYPDGDEVELLGSERMEMNISGQRPAAEDSTASADGRDYDATESQFEVRKLVKRRKKRKKALWWIVISALIIIAGMVIAVWLNMKPTEATLVYPTERMMTSDAATVLKNDGISASVLSWTVRTAEEKSNYGVYIVEGILSVENELGLQEYSIKLVYEREADQWKLGPQSKIEP